VQLPYRHRLRTPDHRAEAAVLGPHGSGSRGRLRRRGQRRCRERRDAECESHLREWWNETAQRLRQRALAFGQAMAVVAAVIDEGALTFDLAIPCEVFGLDRSDIVSPWYEFMVVAAGDSPVRTQTGFLLDTPYRLPDLERADTIVVPGWSDPDMPPSPALCASLRAAQARGARVVSLCTGAFVLAAAGLLSGRRATTHWMYAERLHARHPDVDLDPSVLYVVDGNVMTSAGTAAGIDMCLHLVALDHGVDVAVTVARRLVMPPFRAGGQAQYSDNPIATDVLGEPLSAVLDWARERLDNGLTVDDLADRAAMSPRTLTRRFQGAIGMPPGEWIQRERLRLAQRLLETTEYPLDLVARRAGYSSPTTMRAQFARRLKTSPSGYRETFRGALS
jgi:transcriptional regulator GlxA family with amidase domain